MRYRLKTKPPYRVDITQCADHEIETAGQCAEFANGILKDLAPHIEISNIEFRETVLNQMSVVAAAHIEKRLRRCVGVAALGGLVVGFATGCLFVYSVLCLFALLKG